MLQSAELTNRTAANSILTRHQYQYDSLGRRYRHTETIGSLGTKYLQYGYDALSRLTETRTCATPESRPPVRSTFPTSGTPNFLLV